MKAALVILLLCGAARAEDRQEMSAGDVSRWLSFFDKLVDVVVRDSSARCDKMATDVNVVIDANKDAVAEPSRLVALRDSLSQITTTEQREAVDY